MRRLVVCHHQRQCGPRRPFCVLEALCCLHNAIVVAPPIVSKAKGEVSFRSFALSHQEQSIRCSRTKKHFFSFWSTQFTVKPVEWGTLRMEQNHQALFVLPWLVKVRSDLACCYTGLLLCRSLFGFQQASHVTQAGKGLVRHS